MRIQNNISALNTFRQMGINNAGNAKSLEKLSSGFKINRAGDDAAGLAISEKMRAQVRGLNRASANAQDGISLIQAAEGALQETHSILQRMRQLGVQAANDVNELEDRNAIQDEINQLRTEVDRIANTTEFNKKTLLDGSLKTGMYATKILAGTAVLAGAYIDPNWAAQSVSNDEEVVGIYTIATETVGSKTNNTFSFDLAQLVDGDTLNVSLNIDNSDRPGGQVFEDAAVLTFTATGNAAVDNSTFINQLKEVLQKIVTDYAVSSSGNTITFEATGIGTGWTAVQLEVTEGDNNNGIWNDPEEVSNIEGVDAEIALSHSNPNNSDGSRGELDTVSTEPTDEGMVYRNDMFYDTSEGASGLVFQMADLTRAGSTILEVVAGRNLTFQTGANTGKHQTIDVGIRSLSSASLGIDNLKMDTHNSAQSGVASIENAIQIVSTQRAELGSIQNRLEHTVANLDTVAENLQSAEARIRDVDMAQEMMNFTKFNILTQASQAMMAQANSLPQGVLQLLR